MHLTYFYHRWLGEGWKFAEFTNHPGELRVPAAQAGSGCHAAPVRFDLAVPYGYVALRGRNAAGGVDWIHWFPLVRRAANP